MDVSIRDIRRIEAEPGLSLAVQVSGTSGKPALVLSNSLAADISSWDEVAERLEAHALIVRYDTRGHGGSDVPRRSFDIGRLGQDVLAVMDALGVARAIFCGLSLGGLTGMWLGAHAGPRISALVLANTAASFPPAQMWLDRAAAARKEGLDQFVAPTLERWFTADFRSIAPERVTAIGKVIAATSPDGYAGCCEVLGTTDLLPDLGKIACPTRVIVGTHDPSTPPARGKEIARAIAGTDVVALDAAHLSAVEAKDAFADALLDIIRRAEAT